jgi:D-erythronate 2-dehydrogenase
MRIIITGAGGFVGRVLLTALNDGHDVVALDTRLGSLAGIEGDLCDPDVLDRAFAGGCDAVIHLATVPGGAAEQDPETAKRVNVDGTMALIEASARAGSTPRFIFASSIAVFGDPLPAHVDDDTALAPKMLYGAHKAMMEEWIATQTRRGAISGLSLRFPGILARPRGPSGMKSAFMSNVFHDLKAGEAISLPVSPGATMWLMSVSQLVSNLLHALNGDATGSITLPALRVTMAELVANVANATGADPGLASYAPDPEIQAGFGNQPPLTTARADTLGFRHDGTVTQLVESALTTLT